MNQLEPCPQCERHVKVSEPSCPFCMYSLTEAFANIGPRLAPRARLGRAATFAFGIVAMSQGACDTPGPRPDAAARDASPDVMHDADIPVDADWYDGGGEPIYSAAPTFDGGTPPSPAEQLIEQSPQDTTHSKQT
ncbi:MAG: hypothetical protein HOV81_43235 [Kofleriaceae bacterium]|nr:hypothetical protein [Kofleriaceae bacterium]